MKISKRKFEQGFTLIELIVTVAIFAILSVGVITLMGSVFTSATRQGNSIANADQTRRLSNQIMQELRNAVTASNGAYPIAVASAQELVFFSNVDGGTDIERVRYYLSGGQLRRGIVKQSGNPVGYTGAETYRVVQNDVANGATPLFYYYDENFDDSTDTALVQPVNIATVTYIKLNIMVYKKTSSTSNVSFTVNSGSSLRSLKSNLGD